MQRLCRESARVERRNTGHEEQGAILGLDVHAETVAAAVAQPDGEVCSLGTTPKRAESVRKLIRKLRPVDQLRACYEAGPTGCVLCWQLSELGVDSVVIAPTLAPVKAGGNQGVDDCLHALGKEVAISPLGPGRYNAGLSARARSCGRSAQASGAGDP